MNNPSSLISLKTKSALIIAVFLWASAFVAIRAGLKSYSPEGLALLRYIIASIFMGIIYFTSSKRHTISWRDTLGLLFVGALGIGIYNITLNYGELTMSSGMASFIISQSPLVTTIFAVIFLGERLNFFRILGFIISVFGVALIAIGEGGGGFKWDISVYYILLATIAGGLYSFMQKPFLKNYDVIEATTYVVWGGTLFLLFYTPHLQTDLPNADLNTTLMVIYLGIFPAAIGYIAWSYALSQIPASHAVSFLYFMPFCATILGWLCLNEVPVLLSLVGGLLAIVGVWLVNHSYKVKKILVES